MSYRIVIGEEQRRVNKLVAGIYKNELSADCAERIRFVNQGKQDALNGVHANDHMDGGLTNSWWDAGHQYFLLQRCYREKLTPFQRFVIRTVEWLGVEVQLSNYEGSWHK